MRPRKRMVVYCPSLVEAQQIAWTLETRKPVKCVPVDKLTDISLYQAALVVIVSTSKSNLDYQDLVDTYCSTQVLLWHRWQGATFAEFSDAVSHMLQVKRGPKPLEIPKRPVVTLSNTNRTPAAQTA